MDYSYLLTPSIILFFFLSAHVLNKLGFLPHLNGKNQRYDYLDGLRGIAAILVVCAHSWRFRDIGFVNDVITQADYSYMGKMGAVGVQLFFCITGFLFFEKIFKNGINQDWRKFYISRIKRLAPLFLFFCFLIIFIGIYSAGLSSIDGKSITSAAKFLSFGFMGTTFEIGSYNSEYVTPILWTLPYEWKFYISIPFLAAMCSNKSSGLSLILIVTILYFSLNLTDHFNIWAFFFSGGLVAYITKKNILKNSIYLTIFFYIILIIICVSFFRWSFENYGAMRLLTTSCLFFLAMITKPFILRLKGFVYLGEISYGIYLFHILIIYIYSYFLRKWIFNVDINSTTFLLIVLIYSLLACICCTLTFKYIEYPFMKAKKNTSISDSNV